MRPRRELWAADYGIIGGWQQRMRLVASSPLYFTLSLFPTWHWQGRLASFKEESGEEARSDFASFNADALMLLLRLVPL